ncbi:fructosamine kinase family protein [Nocardioides sp.]|uniref:fructosamine kinase family protein n=1 Tax=Nocardioides sp. TaxID=35761 RepID=UPI00271AAA61|nr:fructosamine kinase family protein [Nocardioides sp.]MDO9456458.1 fructosamine kinase family protein [Nocardioides sp.]
MTRQPVIARRAEQLLGSAVVATAPVAGGDVSIATKLRLSNGTTALMKTMAQPPPGYFEQEAWGLRWLAEAAADGGVHVPEVLAVDADCLVVAWVEPGRTTGDEAAALGRSLAATHAAGAASYGAERDGFIGRLPLPNRPTATWAEFHATRRLLPFTRLASDRGAIEPDDAAAIEAVAARVGELAPEEPPARLHGDLWNGNVLWGADGRAAVIDPAAHGGHREVDLAMLALFGLPHLPRVLDAYAEVTPLADGWEDRIGLFQLFPLLVHACLFGGGYGARAAEVARRYS